MNNQERTQMQKNLSAQALSAISEGAQIELYESDRRATPGRQAALSGVPEEEWKARITATKAWSDYVEAMAEVGIEVVYGQSTPDHGHREARENWLKELDERGWRLNRSGVVG